MKRLGPPYPPGDATTVDTPAVAESPDGSRLTVTRNADLTMSFSFNGGATKPISDYRNHRKRLRRLPGPFFFNGQFVLALTVPMEGFTPLF